MAEMRKYLSRIGGAVCGAGVMGTVLWSLGAFSPPDRVAAVMDRFETVCAPGERREASTDHKGLVAYAGSLPPIERATQLWDQVAEVRFAIKPGRCGFVVDLLPFSPDEEAAVVAAFLDLGARVLPGAVHEDRAKATNTAVFHVLKDRATDPTEFMMLVRFGHSAPSHDQLAMDYGYKLERPNDA